MYRFLCLGPKPRVIMTAPEISVAIWTKIIPPPKGASSKFASREIFAPGPPVGHFPEKKAHFHAAGAL
jgi:hypothetical protein